MNILFKLFGRIFAAIINRAKTLFGYPPAPEAHQIGERLITMRRGAGGRDCAVSALANALGITYEEAWDLLSHKDLPGPLESPILSNPLWLCRAIEKAGFKANDKIKLTALLSGELPPRKTIVLWHAPGMVGGFLGQHWINYEGMNSTFEWLFHWQTSQNLKIKTKQEVIDGVTNGAPNCIISVSEKTV